MVDWSYYEKFHELNEKYLPDYGEGENKASQIVTAVNKLIYKWYNDGDVYDNTGCLPGWCNDLSSYANWIWLNVPQVRTLLEDVWECKSEDDYEALLKMLADTLLDEEWLERKALEPPTGTIYECEAVFRFEETCYEDEEW